MANHTLFAAVTFGKINSLAYSRKTYIHASADDMIGIFVGTFL